jgi:large subunit ribosomal protein L10
MPAREAAAWSTMPHGGTVGRIGPDPLDLPGPLDPPIWKGEEAMPTEAKAAVITDLTERLRRMRAAVLMQTQGLTVAEMTDFRRRLAAAGIEVYVTKNTLLRIASEQAALANLEAILHGQTTIAIGYSDEVAVAKMVSDFITTSRMAHPITIKAGILDRKPIGAAEVTALAKTPPREQLHAEVVGAIHGPLNQTYGVLTAPMRDLINTLEARIRELGGETEAA